jgi:hypothetical protein
MSQQLGKILLTFDVEEFDLPGEYKQPVPLAEQLATGFRGLQAIGDVLEYPWVSTTLFTTAVFAENYPAAIRQLSGKHEIASHCYSHSTYYPEDLLRSKEKLEAITGKTIYGLRMPRMRRVDPRLIHKAGYMYNSSINPTWLPGRYNNLHVSRLPYKEDEVLQFPVSVLPRIRIPLFWLAFKNIPYRVYHRLVLQILRHDHYVCLYFHPWEFVDLSAYKIPFFIKRGGRDKLLMNIKKLITDLSTEGEFITMRRYIQENIQKKVIVKTLDPFS